MRNSQPLLRLASLATVATLLLLPLPAAADCECPDLEDHAIWRDGCEATEVGECYGLTSYTPVDDDTDCPDPQPCRYVRKIGTNNAWCTHPGPIPEGCVVDTSKCYFATGTCGRCWYSQWPVPIHGEPAISWRDCAETLGPMAQRESSSVDLRPGPARIEPSASCR